MVTTMIILILQASEHWPERSGSKKDSAKNSRRYWNWPQSHMILHAFYDVKDKDTKIQMERLHKHIGDFRLDRFENRNFSN